jgi:hypothetical protein
MSANRKPLPTKSSYILGFVFAIGSVVIQQRVAYFVDIAALCAGCEAHARAAPPSSSLPA